MANFNDDDDLDALQQSDEQAADEVSPLGSTPNDVEDIDATMESVGLPSDEDGPHELNSQDVMDRADRDQD
jgi:hypothetical protein